MRSLDEQSVEGARRGQPPVVREDTELKAVGAATPPALTPKSAVGLQRVLGNATVSRMIGAQDGEEQERSPVLDVVGRGGGSPLEGGVKAEMESRLGHDFSDVRVHTDGTAAASAQAVQAHAYTVGHEVVFGSGQYAPGTDAGKHTLAHELTHVVQQRNGPVDGTAAGGGIQLSDPGDRFEQEAEHSAHRAMAGEVPVSAASGTGGSVQREAAPEEDKKKEEEVQGRFIQREGAPEEEKKKEEP